MIDTINDKFYRDLSRVMILSIRTAALPQSYSPVSTVDADAQGLWETAVRLRPGSP
jgi:hypothetical protein